MNISRSAIVPYSAQAMYEIVADIDKYSEFLPWCEKVDVLQRQDQLQIAKMHVAYGKLNFAFTTRNQTSLNEKISLDLVEGPFSDFKGQWSFVPLESSAQSMEGCKVLFDLNFRFKQKLTSMLFSKMFEKIAMTQLDAFQQRARSLYGSQTSNIETL